MAELALDHDQRHAFACHLDGVGVAQLVRREAAPNPGRGGRAPQLRARCSRRPVAATRRAVDDAQQGADGKLRPQLEPPPEFVPSPRIQADRRAIGFGPAPATRGSPRHAHDPRTHPHPGSRQTSARAWPHRDPRRGAPHPPVPRRIASAAHPRAVAATQPSRCPAAPATAMSDDARELLRSLLDKAEQGQHQARLQFRPLRWRRRRETHRCYMEFAPGRRACR